VGDRVRIDTARGASQMFLIAGLFEMGTKGADEQWAIVSMREGQALLGLPGGASDVYLRVRDLYKADAIAARLGGATGLSAESWMASNAQLLIGLRSQSASSSMIQLFVVIAVAMGIASVMIVSVVQRSRAIGILRAMGVPRQRVLRLFLFQGALYGVVGALFGSALGIGLVTIFTRVASPLFPLALSVQRVLLACATALITGVIAAALPARRAAKLDPAVAIRNV
jgi:lipoprotein-releasing system permease protein